ncbi:PREDICTED: uncharacterized protein LOC104788969 [Camelina sativa]|uniref:Uncharacterized protein LOC104788969 n=1 Tax=Camelina sativa TaxID=90675 RepID=A0ABM0ZB23_CAMSA|nr:PREDICTED: uncharacterized protein LOC104788969 [Camelina sativa]
MADFRTMTQNYTHGIIGKTEFNSLLLRGLKEKYLRDRMIDEKKTKEENPNHNDPKVSTAAGPRIRVKLYSTNPEEKMEVQSEVKEKLSDLLKAIEERLSSSEMRLYTSLCKGFHSHRFGYDKFVTYLLQLIEQHKTLYQRFMRLAYCDKGKQKVGVGETRHDQDCLGGDPKIGPQERGVDETNLERKNKKRILSPKDSNLPLKKRKRSKPQRRVTPNYRLIPEGLRSPVSDPVLNNTYVVKRYDFEGGNRSRRRDD